MIYCTFGLWVFPLYFSQKSFDQLKTYFNVTWSVVRIRPTERNNAITDSNQTDTNHIYTFIKLFLHYIITVDCSWVVFQQFRISYTFNCYIVSFYFNIMPQCFKYFCISKCGTIWKEVWWPCRRFGSRKLSLSHIQWAYQVPVYAIGSPQRTSLQSNFIKLLK